MPIIEVVNGHETFSNPSMGTKIYCQFKKKASSEATGLWDASKDKNGGAKQESTSKTYAGVGNVNFGEWITQRYSLVEGSFVLVTVKKTRGGAFPIVYGLILHMRDKAALRRIRIALCGHAKAEQSAIYYEGRFDVLTVKEAAELGFEISSSLVDQYDMDEHAPYFNIEVEQQEIAPLFDKSAIKTVLSPDKAVSLVSAKRKINIKSLMKKGN